MVKKELKGKNQASCKDFFFFLNTIERLYLQKNHLAAAYNFDELGIST